MKQWTAIALQLVVMTSYAGTMGASVEHIRTEGLFIGLGADYNTIHVTQNSWGKGLSTIQTNTGVTSSGIAQGTGAPSNLFENTFAPEVQAGYIKHFVGSDNLYGAKFTYQYLRTTGTTSNLYIPQLGTSTSSTGVSSALYGYVNADSVQVNASHQFNFLALIGRSFDQNKYIYLGAGPSLFNLKSSNYYSIGYAQVDGAIVNVTGLVSYSTPSLWVWGGAAQLGMVYYFNPTWFIDTSYTYAITGNNTTNHQQNFNYASTLGGISYNTFGTLFTKDTLKISNQSLTVSINKQFDF